MARLFHAAAYDGSASTAFFHRYSASFERPFWATRIPNSTCFLASPRSLAEATDEARITVSAQKRRARRMEVGLTIPAMHVPRRGVRPAAEKSHLSSVSRKGLPSL